MCVCVCIHFGHTLGSSMSLSLVLSLSSPSAPHLPSSRQSLSVSRILSLSLARLRGFLSRLLALAFSLSSLPPIIQVQLLHAVVGVVNVWRREYV